MNIRSRRSAGFTLVEIMIALAVLLIATLGLVAVITHTTTANQVNRENLLAMRAAEAKIEEMRQWDVSTIFARYSVTKESELPALPMQLQDLHGGIAADFPKHYFGPDFAPTLSADPTYWPITKQAGFTAMVSFPTAGGAPLKLIEDTTDTNPVVHDLNLNGALGDPDVTSDYRVLPVTITLNWRGIRAINRTLTYRYLFLRRT